MKCRLETNDYCDEDFQIEFNSLTEIKDLRDSLSAMVTYIEMCEEDGDTIPDLIYRIKNNLKNNDYE